MDLNLLVVAAALYKERNVSRAAQDLGLSQSAVSHALARLRDHFDDPMFVRTSKGIAPTEFARGIQDEVMDLVQKTELLINRQKKFDPREARGRITLATTDYFEAVVMPKLQPILAQEAPHLQISLRPTVGDLPKRDLEEGKVDCAIAGFYEDLPEGFYKTRLFSDSFSSATRKGHPKIKSKLTTEEFYSATHALITLQGDFRDQLPEKAVNAKAAKAKKLREIVYGSYSFTGLAWTLQNSDMILTAPTLLLKQYERFFPINVWPCPVPLEKLEVQMIWHAQTHADPLRSWFREICKKVSSQV